jgi:hypothetical protein
MDLLCFNDRLADLFRTMNPTELASVVEIVHPPREHPRPVVGHDS